jgi:hypothetical protein
VNDHRLGKSEHSAPALPPCRTTHGVPATKEERSYGRGRKSEYRTALKPEVCSHRNSFGGRLGGTEVRPSVTSEVGDEKDEMYTLGGVRAHGIVCLRIGTEMRVTVYNPRNSFLSPLKTAPSDL